MIHIAPGFQGNAWPLSHPRIGWRRAAGAASASSAATGFAAANAGTMRTDSFWRATAVPAWWQWDAGAAVSVGYLGIAAHDLGSLAATVTLQRSADGLSFTDVITFAPSDDSAVLALFATASARYWRLAISGPVVPTLGVIALGAVTEMPRKAIYAPSLSFERARVNQFEVNATQGGQFAGRSVRNRSLAAEMQVGSLPEAWVAAEWDAFAAHAEEGTFFLADRPGQFPKSVIYGWTGEDLRAARAVPSAEVAIDVVLRCTGFMAA